MRAIPAAPAAPVVTPIPPFRQWYTHLQGQALTQKCPGNTKKAPHLALRDQLGQAPSDTSTSPKTAALELTKAWLRQNQLPAIPIRPLTDDPVAEAVEIADCIRDLEEGPNRQAAFNQVVKHCVLKKYIAAKESGTAFQFAQFCNETADFFRQVNTALQNGPAPAHPIRTSALADTLEYLSVLEKEAEILQSNLTADQSKLLEQIETDQVTCRKKLDQIEQREKKITGELTALQDEIKISAENIPNLSKELRAMLDTSEKRIQFIHALYHVEIQEKLDQANAALETQPDAALTYHLQKQAAERDLQDLKALQTAHLIPTPPQSIINAVNGWKKTDPETNAQFNTWSLEKTRLMKQVVRRSLEKQRLATSRPDIEALQTGLGRQHDDLEKLHNPISLNELRTDIDKTHTAVQALQATAPLAKEAEAIALRSVQDKDGSSKIVALQLPAFDGEECKTLNTKIADVNKHLAAIADLQPALEATSPPASHDIAAEYQQQRAQLKESVTKLQQYLKEVYCIESENWLMQKIGRGGLDLSLVLQRQSEKYEDFYQKLSELNKQLGTGSIPLSTPDKAKLEELTRNNNLNMYVYDGGGKLQVIRGQNGAPLDISAAAFRKALIQFKATGGHVTHNTKRFSLGSGGLYSIYTFDSPQEKQRFIEIAQRIANQEAMEKQAKQKEAPVSAAVDAALGAPRAADAAVSPPSRLPGLGAAAA